MLKMFKNKRAQNTAEYAILIALVIGGVVAMQTYAQRTIQARLRDASQEFVKQTSDVGNTVQYEPYYANTSSKNDKYASTEESIAGQVRVVNTSKKQGDYHDRTEYISNTTGQF
ncbi:MAG: hypothetical protein HQL22_06685 [Candidatus Omnitrophica bacterium]|nr:hypothetical protein [Candidatus Omnitrophota bacterium]